MKLLKCLLFFCLVFVTTMSDAAGTFNSESKIPIIKNKKIKLATFLEAPSNDILLSIGEGRGSLLALDKRIEFTPSATSTMGLELSYADFEIKWKTLIFGENSSHVKKYGKSKYNEYNLKYSLGHYYVKVFHQATTGFYADLNSRSGTTINDSSASSFSASSPDESIPSNLDQDIWIRPDLRATNWGFNFGLDIPVLDRKRHDAIIKIDLSENKVKEFDFGIHLLSAFDYSNFNLSGSDYLIHAKKKNSFGAEYSQLTGVGYQRIGLDIGLLANWYFGSNFTMFLSGQGGPGIQLAQKISTVASPFALKSAKHFNFKFGVDYNNLKHSFIASFEVDSWNSELAGGYLDVQKTIFLLKYSYVI